jgi:predicted dehydrogenase
MSDGPFRVLRVGAGMWGQSWAELVARGRGFRLAGLVDGARTARDWASATLGCPTFRDLGAALRGVESDAVLIIAPPRWHRPLAEEALAAGRHVAVEKPLALDLTDARAIADAAARAGPRAMVTQNYRFRRQPRALRQLLEARAVGRLRGGRISCRRDLRGVHASRDWRGRMPHPYLLDMAIHHVDLLRMITGRELVEVDARSWPSPTGPFRHDATVMGVLTLSGGIAVGYEGTWVAPTAWTSWNGDWELVGTTGRAAWDGGVGDALRGHVTLERRDGSEERVVLPPLPALDRLGVLHELRRAVRANEEPECSAADNVHSLAAVLALARSTEERRPVRVEEVLLAS